MLEFRYHPAQTETEMRDALTTEINESFAKPITQLVSCTALSYLYQTEKDVRYMAVWFQA